VEHECAWLLMLEEKCELLDFTTKVNENAQEVLYEDEDNDDNDDVEEFARNSIPVLDTETRTALIKCVSPETVFFVGKGMVYRFFFLIILLFNNVNAMMIRN